MSAHESMQEEMKDQVDVNWRYSKPKLNSFIDSNDC